MLDSHAHPLDEGGPGQPLDLGRVTLELVQGEEAERRRAEAAPTRLSQELMAVRLAAYLGCEPEELGPARAEASADWGEYVGGLFRDAGLRGAVLDPGVYEADPSTSRDRFAAASGCEVRPIMRLDTLVDRLIPEGAGAADILAACEAAVRAAPAAGYVGFKTILAYRTGLQVDPGATLEGAQASLRDTAGWPTRRRGKALRDLITRRLLGWCAELGLPLQIHTGFGDSEIRLREADPLGLEELLWTPEGGAATVVLIHGSYPWHEQLAFLALAHANVRAELSLFNLFAPAQVAQRMERVLELAPYSRVLVGTDGHGTPESFWFAARAARAGWAELRQRWRAQGARDSWLEALERSVFEANTARLYGFQGAIGAGSA